MRNKLGLVQIKVRAKDSSDIDLSDLTTINKNTCIVDGNLLDAKGGKLIHLNFEVYSSTEDGVIYDGVTSLMYNDSYISVIGYNEGTSLCVAINLHNDGTIQLTEIQ